MNPIRKKDNFLDLCPEKRHNKNNIGKKALLKETKRERKKDCFDGAADSGGVVVRDSGTVLAYAQLCAGRSGVLSQRGPAAGSAGSPI